MTAELEQYEEIPVYGGRDEQRFALVRTIAAMANTAGGSIHLLRVEGEQAPLDSARLEESVARYVAPRVKGIESAWRSDGSLVIHVPESDAKPHVIHREGVDGAVGGPRAAFHAGQIWVRRGPEDRTADSEDVQRLVREAASRFLERLSIGIRDPSFALRLTEEAGIPVHLVEDDDAVPVSPNLARLYPYTTKTLAAELGWPRNWVAMAAKVLRLKASRENAYGVPSAGGGRIIQWRYSTHALKEIQSRLERNPLWNPYHVDDT